MEKNNQDDNLMEKIVSLCKRRGFIFPSSEIYGGLNSCYDYGPLGVELKNNIKREWWRAMTSQENIVGLDSSILMHPKIWGASGHLEGFTDPLVDCKKCKKRFRADHIMEASGLKPDFQPKDKKHDLKCPECDGELTDVRDFNLMFKTFMGALEESANEIYLRPETAQGIYVNFENVRSSMRLKIPFGIAQIGKAFRNEITPGNFTFRMREFEQMEMQYFINPKDADKWFDDWRKMRVNWYLDLGINKDKLKTRPHEKKELAHYARAACDLEYDFPFGTKELEGIHNRGDWDLSRHTKFSGHDLSYEDPGTKEKFIPWVIETSGGIDRAALTFLIDAYTEIEGGRTTTTESSKEVEMVLKLDKRLAPYKAAILPLSKKENLIKIAKEIYQKIGKDFSCDYDETQAIGRRYRRQDEIGTPYCITVDFESVADNKVTIRDRDTMKQERININEVKDYLKEKLS